MINSCSLIRIALLGMVILVSFSCKKAKEKNDSMIPVGEVFPSLEELKTSDYFTNIRFIPLETTTQSLIGRNPVWQLTGPYVVATTRQGQCLVFDSASGRFICNVGHVGEDPEGYSSTRGIANPVNNQILFRGWKNDLVYYTMNGKWVQKFPVPEIGKGGSLSSFYPIDESRIVGYFPNLTGEEKKRLVFFQNNGDEVSLLPNEQQVIPFNIHAINVLTSHFDIDILPLLGIEGMMQLESEDKEIGNLHFMGLNPFWRYKDNIYFKEEYNDTIYRIQDSQLIPDRVFDLGKYHWPYAERYMKKRDNYMYMPQVIEGESILLFRMLMGMHGREWKSYNGIYHKATGELKINRLEKGIKDDIYHFLDIHPVTASPDGTLLAILSPEEITEWIEENGKDALPPELQHLLKVREDDNPIIVLVN